MTKSLEKAVGAAAKLPPRQQNQVAAFLIEEVMRTEMLAKILTHERARERMGKWLT